MGLNLVDWAHEEPVTLQEARDHCEFKHSDRDDWFNTHIQMARERVEGIVHRQMLTATWDLYLDAFPGTTGWIYLTDHCARPPFQSVSSITYTDVNGDPQTVTATDYVLDTAPESGRITLAYNVTWPVPREIPQSVTIRFVNGYETVADVPATYKGAMLNLVLAWWNRDVPTGEVPTRIAELLWAERRVA